jgi:hypothetical protein
MRLAFTVETGLQIARQIRTYANKTLNHNNNKTILSNWFINENLHIELRQSTDKFVSKTMRVILVDFI